MVEDPCYAVEGSGGEVPPNAGSAKRGEEIFL